MRVCPRCQLKYPNDDQKCFVDGAVLQDVPDERLGTVIAGRYLIESILGEGGMATVYRARHTLVDRPVAVKIMAAHLAKNASLRERFRREAKNAAALAHPNIIEIHDSGETDDGSVFLVMELLDGQPLSDLIARGPMDPELVAALGLQIAQGLARAHDFGVIHRDLKPENIFVCHDGDQRSRVKLLDFGIARSMHDPRLTNKGEIFGTPQYMAPERITSIDAGASVDLYALGAILFEMVTGRLPFQADQIPAFFIKHLQEPPPRPSSLAPRCPRRLEDLILALLAKKPEDRPVDAHQVIKELSALAPDDGRQSLVPATTSPGRQVAPTLPPTTLERWQKRALVFEEMLKHAWPRGGGPPELTRALDAILTTLATAHDLRAEGLKSQRRLEAMEANVREGRERLGHAVHTLAVDLSQAREAARQARLEVEPYFEQDRQAEAAYHGAHKRLEGAGGYHEMNAPRPHVVSALREAVDALDHWLLARGAADKAHRWVDAKVKEVEDLEFQVSALRQQSERLEASYDTDRRSSEEQIVSTGREVERLEQALLESASRFCAPLRPRRDLAPLFARLEQEAP